MSHLGFDDFSGDYSTNKRSNRTLLVLLLFILTMAITFRNAFSCSPDCDSIIWYFFRTVVLSTILITSQLSNENTALWEEEEG